MSPKDSQTPMMGQYTRIKKEYQDAIVFFRMGDFYEMFYEDAKTASTILEIALTSRQKVPMCGVPHHAADSYIAKLLKQGLKVAVCEQVEDAKLAKGIVKRDVVKVLTPGTAVEVELVASKENKYIASLYLKDQAWGLAVIDLASGQMQTSESDSQKSRFLSDELFRLSPKEIIFSEEEEAEVMKILSENQMTSVLKSPVEDWIFDFFQAQNFLLDHFRVKSLAGFGLDEKNMAVSAGGALLYYLKKVRKDSLALVHRIAYVHSGEHMVLDATTIKNLELVRNLRDGSI